VERACLHVTRKQPACGLQGSRRIKSTVVALAPQIEQFWRIILLMIDSDTQKRLTDLSSDAKESLSELLQLPDLRSEQWFMRRREPGQPAVWEALTNNSQENDRQIKSRIEASGILPKELSLAFVGMVEWRGQKQLMAYLQCFRSGYKQGILCLRNLQETSDHKFEPHGEFLIVGSCQNIWI
jgi:hypothetical protein